ncbi:TetR/AcrR family transcriptional regulator [Dactylosporangium fulvum]|uniref:TetR/AcrR family transcriptional regulator n=1 Tax=Dactylosporangium fulvum TaxID=53359 RepID=A0ABY5VMF5_9ACTN|nr:TetR/AcrR family transcriptional regulator [Dactylosporangium fulvum]UWP78550.1 TetR/AcrR family transcriptional regulator [Dactylosporangium fulvum]
MGHREDLLDGAVRCLYEKGYARTTARDIVAASGTNLGSIGYHYGSTQALLNAALGKAIDDWGGQLAQALTASPGAQLTGLARFEAYWTNVLDTMAAHRPVLMASFDAVLQMDHAPELHRMLAEGMQDARKLWAQVFHQIDAAVEREKAHQLGSFYQALLSGLIAQWLIDPEHAPSGRDLAEALRMIAADLS